MKFKIGLGMLALAGILYISVVVFGIVSLLQQNFGVGLGFVAFILFLIGGIILIITSKKI